MAATHWGTVHRTSSESAGTGTTSKTSGPGTASEPTGSGTSTKTTTGAASAAATSGTSGTRHKHSSFFVFLYFITNL